MRKVASQAGVKYYGAPIGTPITPDLKAAAKAKNGGKSAPAGSSSSNAAPRSAVSYQAENARKQAEHAAATAPVAPTLSITPPPSNTPKGNTVQAGTAVFAAPKNSRTFHQSGSDVQYNVDSTGKLRVFSPKGEVNLTPEQESRVKALMLQQRTGLQESGTEASPDDEEPARPVSRFAAAAAARANETPDQKSAREAKEKADADARAAKVAQNRADLRSKDASLKSKDKTGVFNEHDPSQNTAAETTPLTELGFKPDDVVTVYRGIPSGANGIEEGDWVTDDPQLAKDYAGGGKVVSMKIKAQDLLADPSSGEGGYTNEMVYKPKSKR